MKLTERQDDALAELINIAFSRTAASLSELTDHRVLLDPPRVEVYPIDQLHEALGNLVGQDLATVHQVFMGPMAGDAFLVLDYQGALHLVDLLAEGYRPPARMDASAREVLTEVGNILLNACLGMFGNLLQMHISFSVPRLHLEDLHTLLTSLLVGGEELRYALFIYTNFRLRSSAVSGHLVIVLGVTSLDRLIQAVEEWEESVVGG